MCLRSRVEAWAEGSNAPRLVTARLGLVPGDRREGDGVVGAVGGFRSEALREPPPVLGGVERDLRVQTAVLAERLRPLGGDERGLGPGGRLSGRLDLGRDRPDGVDGLDSGALHRRVRDDVAVVARGRVADHEVGGRWLVGQDRRCSGECRREHDNDGAGRDHDASHLSSFLSCFERCVTVAAGTNRPLTGAWRAV